MKPLAPLHCTNIECGHTFLQYLLTDVEKITGCPTCEEAQEEKDQERLQEILANDRFKEDYYADRVK